MMDSSCFRMISVLLTNLAALLFSRSSDLLFMSKLKRFERSRDLPSLGLPMRASPSLPQLAIPFPGEVQRVVVRAGG